MKKIRIIIYASLLAFIILMSAFIFNAIGNISNELHKIDFTNQFAPQMQSIYIFLILLVFVVFLCLLGLLIWEINEWIKEKKAIKIQELTIDTEEKVVEEDESEDLKSLQKEQEEAKYIKLQEEFYTCVSRDMESYISSDHKVKSEKLLHCISSFYEITQGEIFLKEKTDHEDKLVLSSTFAFYIPEEKVYEFKIGEGLIGQVAKAGESLYMDQLPEGYITVKSGLGAATPTHLLISPWKNQEGETIAVIEIASFKAFTKADIKIIEGLSEKILEIYNLK